MLDLRAGTLAGEMGCLAKVTSQHAWCEDDQSCKVVPISEYVKALSVAIILAKVNPRLDMPVPGADPAGYVWLTYVESESQGLALELLPGKYRWTQTNMGMKQTFESQSLDDVAEAMRTVFPKP